MNCIARIIVLLVSGCSFDEAALRNPALDAGLPPPVRGPAGLDAGVAPDLRVVPDAIAGTDLGAPSDTKPQNTDVLIVSSDAQPSPDGLSHPHDVIVTDAVPCMQQVIANGYASDKASCMTWKWTFTEPYNSNLAVPWTSESACKFIIDCFAAKPEAHTSWYKSDGSCVTPIPGGGGKDGWQPLIDIISPFCPAFFTR